MPLPSLPAGNFRNVVIRNASNPLPILRWAFLFWAAVLTVAAVVVPHAAATPPGAPAASASSIIGRDARLNGAPLAAGATLFPNDVIHLGEGSTAALRFDSGMVLAAAGTELTVQAGGVNLLRGFLQIRSNGAEPIFVQSSLFRVSMASASGIPGSAEIRIEGARATVSAIAGTADLTASSSGAAPVRLRAGETATFGVPDPEADAAQTAAEPLAGQVSRLLPQVQIDRGAQHIVAAAADRVYWNDALRSGPTGRAHVTLKDGSQLNLGSDSTLRILQHDAQAQQTSLDLLVGRLRGKINKQKPGGKFEVRTPMGIAGLVGTDFSLLVTNDYAELMVFEGAVKFTASTGQTVTVSAGMKARISKSGMVDGPVALASGEALTAQNLTDIAGSAAKGTAAAGASGSPTVPLVITLTGAAAGVGIGVWQATRPTVSVSIP